jgi:hypothetical protein
MKTFGTQLDIKLVLAVERNTIHNETKNIAACIKIRYNYVDSVGLKTRNRKIRYNYVDSVGLKTRNRKN